MTATGDVPALDRSGGDPPGDDRPAGGGSDAADEASALRPVADLPGPIRQRIVEWAADTLGAMAPADVPAPLARVARFAPAKRAKVAATALGQAVSSDGAFRAQVAERAAKVAVAEPDSDPNPALGADRGQDRGAEDLVVAAARAYLLRLPELEDLLGRVVDRSHQLDVRDRSSELERQVRQLTVALERSQAALAASRSEQDAGGPAGQVDAERLRRRLREQGSKMRDLQQLLDQTRVAATEAASRAEGERDRARAEVELWRQRAQAATAKAEAATQSLQRQRDAAGDRKSTSDRRIELLLGALEGAASGLRREWDLVGGGMAPADVVAARLPDAPAAAERTADPARLLAWVGLPGAHLIVDGYNVSKTGFAELSLSEQRDRLIRMLAALAARTSAEVTVVFDGAAVATARPLGRGIRVLFSAAGVLADDVIKELVRAEPRGRVVVVVSSDRQVVDTAARDGARTAPSAVFLAAIGT